MDCSDGAIMAAVSALTCNSWVSLTDDYSWNCFIVHFLLVGGNRCLDLHEVLRGKTLSQPVGAQSLNCVLQGRIGKKKTTVKN